MHAGELLSGPSLAFGGVIIWSKFGLLRSCYLVQVTKFAKKLYEKTIKYGFQHILVQKKSCALKFQGKLSGPSWPFFTKAKFQIITPTWTRESPLKMVVFALFCFSRCAEPIDCVFLHINQILPKNGPNKKR